MSKKWEWRPDEYNGIVKALKEGRTPMTIGDVLTTKEKEKKMSKNLKGKTRKVDNPYEIYVNERAGWEWRILKHYQSPDKEKSNPYARVFVAAKSPMTYGSFEMGDEYLKNVQEYGRLIFEDKNLK